MPYDPSWIIYQLTDSGDYQIMAGSESSGVYALKVSKKYSQWKMSLFDFLQFQETYNKNIILSISDEDFEAAKRQNCIMVIDFNRNDFGDPWEEFNRIVWCAPNTPLFATGW